MAVNNFIFIFLLLYFGSIESKGVRYSTNSGSPKERDEPGESFSEVKSTSRNPDCRESSNHQTSAQSIAGALVINEIMADPTPVAGLPDREYLELYNSGSLEVKLKGWILELGSKQKSFPDISVASGEYLLVTAPGGSKDLGMYGRVVEISGFLLNNSGVSIALIQPDKAVTDRIDYLPALHTKGFEDGGFSLERIDPLRMCGQPTNWTTTLSPQGGTPGRENTVKASNLDVVPPKVVSSVLADHARVDILLSERFLMPALPSDAVRNLSAGVVQDSVVADPANCLLQIYFRPASVANGRNYSFLLHGIRDECGNVLADQTIAFGFYSPRSADLLISEVLFNPYPEGSEFVEIYNNSGFEVDLSELWLATRDGSKMLKQVSQISYKQQYLPAKSYLALTKSREGVLGFYMTKCTECILQMEKFPTLTNESGAVVLLNQQQEVIDEMYYSESMHHPFMSGVAGISLERINFSEPASRQENWQSSARSNGFATPGYQNSVSEVAGTVDQMVEIDPQVFSPNGDGTNDQLKIGIHTEEPGWILNITILNCAGRVVRKLANNFTTGREDHLFWDGLNSDFQKVQPGIYLLQVSLFEPAGKHQNFRIGCVVTDRP